jgi:hypothetical protein
MTRLRARLDHLVIVARSLDEGVRWFEDTLGVTPGPGGKHPLMGTHNRLQKVATAGFPRAYLEIIAIDPDAPAPGRRRWFDMDDEVLRERVRVKPRLVHFVASSGDAQAALDALAQAGIDAGPLLRAERPTPNGFLQWRISVRDDGKRLFDGALPTLIQWGDVHPSHTMTDGGLQLKSLRVSHPQAAQLGAAYRAIGLARVPVEPGPPNISATFETPKGVITLQSEGA